MSIEIPEIMQKAAKESTKKEKRITPGIIKGIDIYWQNMNKEIFVSKCRMGINTCRRIFRFIQEYKEKNNLKELTDNDYEYIEKEINK
jgi:hypothetical protein